MDSTKKKNNLERYLSSYIQLLSELEDRGISKKKHGWQNQVVFGVILDLNMIIKTNTLPVPIELPFSGIEESTIDVKGINEFLKRQLSMLSEMEDASEHDLEQFVQSLSEELRGQFGGQALI